MASRAIPGGVGGPDRGSRLLGGGGGRAGAGAQAPVGGGHRRGGREPRPADQHAVHLGDLPAAPLRHAGRHRGRRPQARRAARRAMGDGQPDDVALPSAQGRQVPRRQAARGRRRQVLHRAVHRPEEPPLRVRARHRAGRGEGRQHRGRDHVGAGRGHAVQRDAAPDPAARDAREGRRPGLRPAAGRHRALQVRRVEARPAARARGEPRVLARRRRPQAPRLPRHPRREHPGGGAAERRRRHHRDARPCPSSTCWTPARPRWCR